jgi:hypothetical protein
MIGNWTIIANTDSASPAGAAVNGCPSSALPW